MKILIVDEEAVVAAVIAEWAQMQGHEAVTVHDRDAACQLIASTQFDAIVGDFGKSGASGRETITRIRQRYPAIPMIVIAGQFDAVSRADIERLGVTATLEKPIALAQLAQALARVTRRSATGREEMER